MKIEVTATPQTKMTGMNVHIKAGRDKAHTAQGLETAIGRAVESAMQNMRMADRDPFDYNYIVIMEKRNDV